MQRLGRFVSTAAMLGLVAMVAGCATTSGADSEGVAATSRHDSGWLPVHGSPGRGPGDAPVTVVHFGDFLCGTCERTATRIADLRERRDDVRVVYKLYPAQKKANRLAARAAVYARRNGAFWAFHDAVYERRKAVRENPRDELPKIAGRVGLEESAVAGLLDEQVDEASDLPEQLREDLQLGRRLGLERTPAVFVNGRLLEGREEIGRLAETVESARDETDRLLKGDVAVSRLYQTASNLAHDRQGLEGREIHRGRIRETGGANAAMVDSEKIPVGDRPVRGPDDALVTVVVFSDFQCPFCRKGYKRIERLREAYPERVRIVYRHFPLPMHEHARSAARIAMAAREQGEKYFWKMHDRLFETQERWKDGGVRELAVEWADQMGLDVQKFEDALRYNEPTYEDRIDEDMKFGKSLGVKGTPQFFINGVRLAGAQSYDRFESAVESQFDRARALRDEGIPRRNIYKKAVRANLREYEREQAEKEKKKKKKKEPRKKVEYVPIEADDPTRGAPADEALVTFVMFEDFECPFSDKAVPAVEKLVENYGDRVRFVFKHRPLGFHKAARPAAKAAIAAQKQGKFWEMHDLLFKNQKELVASASADVYVDYAEQIGLDVDRFEKEIGRDEVAEKIEEDIELAEKIGAKGTPNFWINGVNVVGAQPYSKFEEVVEQQLDRAEKLRKKGKEPGEGLYRAAVELNREKLGGSEATEETADEKEAGDEGVAEPPSAPKVDTSALKVGNSATRGPKDAPVTIYVFSDFECPYCAKAHPTVAKIMDEYEGEVRLVHKHFPLPMHDNARPAARAAIAAGKQGKYWEMYDLMYENQKKLGNDGIFETWAKQLGLNVSKFEEDMKEVPDSEIVDDMEMGKKVGVRGTPAFVINGRRLVGAQPYSKFEALIESELED